MDLQFLNDALSAFLQAFVAAAVALVGVGLTALGVLAVIGWYTSYRYTLASGVGLGDALAQAVLIMVTVAITGWVVLNLPTMTEALYQAFATWGSGGTPVDLLNPAALVDQGFRQARPIRTFTDNITSWLKVWDWDTLLIYSVSYYLIVLGFFFIALSLVLIVIEFKLAVMLGAVLIPTAAWQTSAFLAEAAVGWILGGAVRVFVITALVGISQPLFARVTPTLTGGDPDFKSAVLCGLVSGLFALLAWILPRRAASLVGQGLALGAGDAVGGAMAGYRGARVVVTGVTRVTSHLLNSLRG